MLSTPRWWLSYWRRWGGQDSVNLSWPRCAQRPTCTQTTWWAFIAVLQLPAASAGHQTTEVAPFCVRVNSPGFAPPQLLVVLYGTSIFLQTALSSLRKNRSVVSP